MGGRFEELEALLASGGSLDLAREAYGMAAAGMSMHDALELCALRLGPFLHDLTGFPTPPMGGMAAFSLHSGVVAGPPQIVGAKERAALEVGPGGGAERRTRDFLVQFQDAANGVLRTPGLAALLYAAFEEMIDNAVEHGASAVYPVAAYDCRGPARGGDGISFSVTDAGVGVLERLRQSPAYSALNRGTDALELALRDGVSSRLGGGGYGFKPIFDAIAFRGGRLRVRSSTGEAVAIARALQPIHKELTPFPERRGLHVRVEFKIYA